MENENETKWEKYWWTKKASYMGFFIRELSSIPIVIYIIFLLISTYFQINGETPAIIKTLTLPAQIIGFLGAIIHSLTWLPAVSKTLPIELSEAQEKIINVIVFTSWIILSYLIYLLIYSN
jgi:fumarate reductase subunit C